MGKGASADLDRRREMECLLEQGLMVDLSGDMLKDLALVSLVARSLGRDGDSSIADHELVLFPVGCAVIVDVMEEEAGRLLTLMMVKSPRRLITKRCPSRRAIPCDRACGQYLVMNSSWGIPMAKIGMSMGHHFKTVFPIMVVIAGREAKRVE